MSSPVLQKRNGEPKKREVFIFSDAMGERFEKVIVLRSEGEVAQCTLLFYGAMPHTARLTVRLTARKARAEIIAVFVAQGNEKSSIDITLSHEAPETFGRVLFRGILRDASRLALRGMLRIAKGANGSDSYLNAKALLLSKKAIARIDPQLEILASDVKASHGAAVGKLSERDLFYLRSRGLNRREAERVLVKGFFADALAALPESALAKLPSDLV